MKTALSLGQRAVTFALWLGLCATLPGQPPSFGVITGSVSNPATGQLLEGATIDLEGVKGVSTVSDRGGGFSLGRVPAGAHTVVVSYPGLDSQRYTVLVESGRETSITAALSSEIYRMSEFHVLAEREGNALAIALQKAATNVKNVVSADAYGSVSDANVGNLLQRLPDISADFSIGDVTYIRVRGIDPNLNSVTVDGTRMANEDLISTRRQFRFNQFSISNVDKIEVVKAPTPDMDADAIGGSINLVSKSAFDSDPARRLGGSLGFHYRISDHPDEGSFDWSLAKRRLTTKLQPDASVYYSEVFAKGERKLGVRFDANFSPRYSDQEQANSQYQATTSSPAYTWQFQTGDLRHIRTIAGTGLKFDFRPTARTTYSLGLKYNYLHHTNEFNRFTVQTSQSLATFDANGNRTGTGTIRPGYTDLVTEALPSTSTTGQVYFNQPREVYAPSRQVILKGRHLLDAWQIDYDMNLSRAVSNIDTGDFGGNVTSTLTNIGWKIDRTRSLQRPDLTQTAGPDWYDINNYKQLTLTLDDVRNGSDTIFGGQFNARRKFETRWPTALKSGFRFRQQTRVNHRAQRVFEYAGPDGIRGVNPATGVDDGNIAGFLDTTYDYGYKFFGQYRPWSYPSVAAVRVAQREHPTWFQENYYTTYSTPLSNELFARERVFATYAMGSVELPHLTVLAGVRAERTDTQGAGPRRADTLSRTPTAETREQAQARALADYPRRETASGSYTNAFPGIHVKYEPWRRVVLRGSATNSIGRPTFDNIIPATRIDEVRQTVTVTNPSIKPQYSRNYDLSAEYYYASSGLLSVGAFRKEIRDFIQQLGGDVIGTGAQNGFNGQYAGYNLITARNLGSALIQGVSLNMQQQFTFLPGRLRGLGAYANYTSVKSEGSRSDQGLGSRLELGGFVPKTFNAGISYSESRYSVRVQMNFRGASSELSGTNVATVVQRADYRTVNAGAEIKLSRRMSAYLDIINLTNEPERTVYKVDPSRTRTYSLSKAEVSGGIKAQF